MKAFEAGKEYHINGGGSALILKRSKHYATIRIANDTKRKMIYQFGDRGLFGLGEHIVIKGEHIQYFCFAAHENK